MKKMILLLTLVLFTLPLGAQGLATALETPQNFLELDMSTGVHGKFLQTYSTTYNNSVISGSYGLRGGFDGTLRLVQTDWLSFGASLGLYSLDISSSLGSEVFVDVPVRVILRLGFSGFNVEPHVGYLFSNTALRGLEYGIKTNLLAFYFDYTTLVGPWNCTRAGFGLQLNKLFAF